MLSVHPCFYYARICMHADPTQAQLEKASTAAAITTTVAMCTLCSAVAHVSCLVCATNKSTSSGTSTTYDNSTQHQAVIDSVTYSDILQAVEDNSWVCNGCLEQLKLHGRACCDVITAKKRDSHVHAVATTAASK
jgi:hypothetical protein